MMPEALTRATGAFEKVDYSDLNDIVVWLEPAGFHGAGRTRCTP